MTPKKFRQKPVEVEAMHLTADTVNEVARWVGDTYALGGGLYGSVGNCLTVETEDGEEIQFDMDSWIIRGVDGEFHAMSEDAFDEMYGAAEGEAH